MTGDAPLAALRRELAAEGLYVVRVVTQAALDRCAVPFRLDQLLPGAASALVVGDGGAEFFSRSTVGEGASDLPDDLAGHPIDAHTAVAVPRAVARAAQAVPGFSHAVAHPFSRDLLLPIQRIGEAAGLPAAGPLGLQVHPRFGPWWAYRALVVLDLPLQEEAPLARPCTGCPAPCIPACPGGATSSGGLDVGACVAERLASEPCQHSCAARLACIAGPEHRYPAGQLGYHMDRSLHMIRRYLASGGTLDSRRS